MRRNLIKNLHALWNSQLKPPPPPPHGGAYPQQPTSHEESDFEFEDSDFHFTTSDSLDPYFPDPPRLMTSDQVDDANVALILMSLQNEHAPPPFAPMWNVPGLHLPNPDPFDFLMLEGDDYVAGFNETFFPAPIFDNHAADEQAQANHNQEMHTINGNAIHEDRERFLSALTKFCPGCNNTFKTESLCKAHWMAKHDKDMYDYAPDGMTCHLCRFRFFNPDVLSVHLACTHIDPDDEARTFAEVVRPPSGSDKGKKKETKLPPPPPVDDRKPDTKAKRDLDAGGDDPLIAARIRGEIKGTEKGHLVLVEDEITGPALDQRERRKIVSHQAVSEIDTRGNIRTKEVDMQMKRDNDIWKATAYADIIEGRERTKKAEKSRAAQEKLARDCEVFYESFAGSTYEFWYSPLGTKLELLTPYQSKWGLHTKIEIDREYHTQIDDKRRLDLSDYCIRDVLVNEKIVRFTLTEEFQWNSLLLLFIWLISFFLPFCFSFERHCYFIVCIPFIRPDFALPLFLQLLFTLSITFFPMWYYRGQHGFTAYLETVVAALDKLSASDVTHKPETALKAITNKIDSNWTGTQDIYRILNGDDTKMGSVQLAYQMWCWRYSKTVMRNFPGGTHHHHATSERPSAIPPWMCPFLIFMSWTALLVFTSLTLMSISFVSLHSPHCLAHPVVCLERTWDQMHHSMDQNIVLPATQILTQMTNGSAYLHGQMQNTSYEIMDRWKHLPPLNLGFLEHHTLALLNKSLGTWSQPAATLNLFSHLQKNRAPQETHSVLTGLTPDRQKSLLDYFMMFAPGPGLDEMDFSLMARQERQLIQKDSDSWSRTSTARSAVEELMALQDDLTPTLPHILPYCIYLGNQPVWMTSAVFNWFISPWSQHSNTVMRHMSTSPLLRWSHIQILSMLGQLTELKRAANLLLALSLLWLSITLITMIHTLSRARRSQIALAFLVNSLETMVPFSQLITHPLKAHSAFNSWWHRILYCWLWFASISLVSFCSLFISYPRLLDSIIAFSAIMSWSFSASACLVTCGLVVLTVSAIFVSPQQFAQLMDMDYSDSLRAMMVFLGLSDFQINRITQFSENVLRLARHCNRSLRVLWISLHYTLQTGALLSRWNLILMLLLLLSVVMSSIQIV
jgi:hypothetical protein